MKARAIPSILAILLPVMLGNGSTAAPAPPAGRPREITSIEAHRCCPRDLAFSPDGKTLVTGGEDGAVKLWEVMTGKNLFAIPGPREREPGFPHEIIKALPFPMRAYGVAFSPDGKTFASCGCDEYVRLWNAVTGKNTESIPGPCFAPLLFSPDGTTLFCGYWLIDLKTKEVRKFLKEGGSWPTATIAFDPKGRPLYAASPFPMEESIFCLWDVETGKKTSTCKSYSTFLIGLEFSRDGKTVACIGDDKTLRLWDTATGENTESYKLPERLNVPRFSPDGKIVAMINGTDWQDPCDIFLFDLSSRKIIATLRGHKQGVFCLAFSRDGRLLASGSHDGSIKIWSLPKRYAADTRDEKKKGK